MNNQNRIQKLMARGLRTPKFSFGQTVIEPYGKKGAIDCIYADYQAALDQFCIREGWYEGQERRPKTPKTGFFYAVVIEEGAVLVGEDDLRLAGN